MTKPRPKPSKPKWRPKSAPAKGRAAKGKTSKVRSSKDKSLKVKSASIMIKRAYEAASADDGIRVLVDRLWPRGLSKASFKYDVWPKDLAPSNELRKWYGHDPERAAEFRRRYRGELAVHRDDLAALRAKLKGHNATLLTATHEIDLSHAVVLRDLLEK
jgi:uncharacterized protein YeaO (DUF488 family)